MVVKYCYIVKTAREIVTEKFNRREEILTGMLEQRQASIEDHEFGRKLLSEEVRQNLRIAIHRSQ